MMPWRWCSRCITRQEFTFKGLFYGNSFENVTYKQYQCSNCRKEVHLVLMDPGHKSAEEDSHYEDMADAQNG